VVPGADYGLGLPSAYQTLSRTSCILPNEASLTVVEHHLALDWKFGVVVERDLVHWRTGNVKFLGEPLLATGG